MKLSDYKIRRFTLDLSEQEAEDLFHMISCMSKDGIRETLRYSPEIRVSDETINRIDHLMGKIYGHLLGKLNNV